VIAGKLASGFFPAASAHLEGPFRAALEEWAVMRPLPDRCSGQFPKGRDVWS